jgi:hypothetical protein
MKIFEIKLIELKKLLVDILNIATAQSKSLTDEYLSRQNELEGQIEEAEKLKNSIESEMKEFVEKVLMQNQFLINLDKNNLNLMKIYESLKIKNLLLT